jgi:hypothetical protein
MESLLLEDKVSFSTSEGWNHLHIAAMNDCENAVRVYVGKGENPNQLTSIGWSPLYYAVHGGHLRTVDVLLSVGADPCEASVAHLLRPDSRVQALYPKVVKRLLHAIAMLEAKRLRKRSASRQPNKTGQPHSLGTTRSAL